MKRYMMAALSFALLLLVCRVGANFPCKPEQIHWNTTGKVPKCLNCPDCPAGSQPSVPCGSSVIQWPDIHCVPCTLGKTYSDKYDKAQCKACSVCSTGKVLKKNCTLFSNSQCDNSKCKQGYYSVPFIFDCLPCSQCCNDGGDESASECANQEKKCKVRSSPCANALTTNVPTTMVIPPTSTTSQTTQPVESTQSEITTPLTKEVEKPSTSSVFHGRHVEPTSGPAPHNDDKDDSAVKAMKSAEEDGGNGTVVTLAAVIALLVIACAFLLGYGLSYALKLRRLNSIPNEQDMEGMGLPQIKKITSPSQEHLNPDDVTLEQLENENLELFDWVCTRLDNGRLRFRRDYERLASKYQKISLEARNSLRNESLSEGRSPSKLLMSHLQTSYPSLPLRHFVKSLKDIGRNDIAQKLTPHIRNNVV